MALLPSRARLALGIEYDGSDFHGWQRLGKHGVAAARTVQEVLEDALSRVAAMPVDTICAGRTDAGVHGHCQVVHFDTTAERSLRSWELGTTANLPPDVSLRWCVPVAQDFNARFSARARRYRYVIANRALRPALARRMVTWVRPALDADAMHRAAQALVGEHDFSALRTVHCQAPHARRDLHAISVLREGDRITVDVQANAFLHHMVRNIVGSLLMVGTGERPVAWMAQVLAGGDRTLAGPTAPATGLVFVGPCYPAQWGLPAEVTMAAPNGG